MFPIHSLSGRVLGFGGRTKMMKKTAKYINLQKVLFTIRAGFVWAVFAKRPLQKKIVVF